MCTRYLDRAGYMRPESSFTPRTRHRSRRNQQKSALRQGLEAAKYSAKTSKGARHMNLVLAWEAGGWDAETGRNEGEYEGE